MLDLQAGSIISEFEKYNEKLDPSLQLGHVLYDLEQLKIFTQTVWTLNCSVLSN